MGFGFKEILIVAILILIIFGRGKITEFMKELGKGISSFKKGVSEGKEEDEPKKVSKKAPAKKAAPKKTTKA